MSAELKESFYKDYQSEFADYNEKSKKYHDSLTPDQVEALAEFQRDKKLMKENRAIRQVGVHNV